MSFGKHSPNELWSRGNGTAELQSNRGNPTIYVRGYFEAARHLALGLAANQIPPDTVAYPALFLFRHAIEIGFKALLRSYSFELNIDQLYRKSGDHSLQNLWSALRPRLESDDFLDGLEPERCSAQVTLDDIDALVLCLHEVDPNGTAARYDVSLDGRFTMAEVNRVNLEVLLDLCRLTEDWITSHLDAREELVSFVRVERLGRGEL